MNFIHDLNYFLELFIDVCKVFLRDDGGSKIKQKPGINNTFEFFRWIQTDMLGDLSICGIPRHAQTASTIFTNHQAIERYITMHNMFGMCSYRGTCLRYEAQHLIKLRDTLLIKTQSIFG